MLRPKRSSVREAISAYFRQTQGRGHRCTVDPYLRVQRYHYFCVYPDDYANTYLGHNEDGQFVRRPSDRRSRLSFCTILWTGHSIFTPRVARTCRVLFKRSSVAS